MVADHLGRDAGEIGEAEPDQQCEYGDDSDRPPVERHAQSRSRHAGQHSPQPAQQIDFAVPQGDHHTGQCSDPEEQRRSAEGVVGCGEQREDGEGQRCSQPGRPETQDAQRSVRSRGDPQAEVALPCRPSGEHHCHAVHNERRNYVVGFPLEPKLGDDPEDQRHRKPQVPRPKMNLNPDCRTLDRSGLETCRRLPSLARAHLEPPWG